MTDFESSPEGSQTPSTRKPRIAIMGEFSVGKSTLSNLLIGSNPLPVRVTATQLPPVWLAYGDQDPYREDLDGNSYPVDLENLEDIPLQETAVIRIFLKAEILEDCDILDMPGISDPNMPPEVWERMIHHADGVLWCTHATQAWRQSEAAVWKAMPESLFANSFLLITRIDKLITERDRLKVIRRVASETEGLFVKTYPISLTQALAAEDDEAKWESSGAHAFAQGLMDLLGSLSIGMNTEEMPLVMAPASAPESESIQRKPKAVEPDVSEAALQDHDPETPAAEDNVFHLEEPAAIPEANPAMVMPRRVASDSDSGGSQRRVSMRPDTISPVGE